MAKTNLNIVDEDFVQLAKNGDIGVLVHICDCFSRPISKISEIIEKEFEYSTIDLEDGKNFGSIDKLGRLGEKTVTAYGDPFFLVGMYAHYNADEPSMYGIKVDYDVLRVCLRKVGMQYTGGIICIPYDMSANDGPKLSIFVDMINDELSRCAEIIVPKL